MVKWTQYVLSVAILESLRSKRGKAPGQPLSTVPYAEKVTVCTVALFIETSAVHLPSVLGCTCDFPPISAHSDRDYSTSRRSWYRRVVIWSGLSLTVEIALIVDNNLAASGKRSGPLNSLNWGMSAEVRSPQTIIVSLKTQASMGHGIRSG